MDRVVLLRDVLEDALLTVLLHLRDFVSHRLLFDQFFLLFPDDFPFIYFLSLDLILVVFDSTFHYSILDFFKFLFLSFFHRFVDGFLLLNAAQYGFFHLETLG